MSGCGQEMTAISTSIILEPELGMGKEGAGKWGNGCEWFSNSEIDHGQRTARLSWGNRLSVKWGKGIGIF